MKELSTKLSSTLLRTGRAAKTVENPQRHHGLYPEVQQSGFPSVLGEPMCRTEGHRTLGMGYCSVLWAPGLSGSLTHLLASVPISHCHTGHMQTTRKQCSHLHQPRHLVRRKAGFTTDPLPRLWNCLSYLALLLTSLLVPFFVIFLVSLLTVTKNICSHTVGEPAHCANTRGTKVQSSAPR